MPTTAQEAPIELEDQDLGRMPRALALAWPALAMSAKPTFWCVLGPKEIDRMIEQSSAAAAAAAGMPLVHWNRARYCTAAASAGPTEPMS